MKKTAFFAIALVSSAPLWAATPPVPADISLISENGVLVPRTSGASMPIYTFDRDTTGKPTCTGSCAASWPPVLATPHSKAVGDWTIIPLGGANSQWAYKGKPVYTYAADTAGKATGDGMGGVWHLVPPLPDSPSGK